MSTALAPRTPNPAATLNEEFELALTKGEKVLMRGEPDRKRLFQYMMTVAFLANVWWVFGLLLLPIIYFVQKAFVKKHHYWVTNSRVIVNNGIIGFRARSIPLERISDVAVSCNWLEKAFGLRSVIVRDMTGEAMAGAKLLACPDATEIQQLILNEVHKVNRRAGGHKGDDMQARPYREIEGDAERREMLELLRRIEKNTRES